MKILISLFLICLGLSLNSIEAQIVKDPLLHFYGLGESKAEDKFYEFSADFTGDGRQSVFITDEQSREGPHGDYAWMVYYPLSSGGYQIINDQLTARLSGPDYIGYIDEVKRYGMIIFQKNTVTAQYLDNGKIKMEFLSNKNSDENEKDFAKYLKIEKKLEVTTFSLDQLKQKYANPDPNNIVKLSTEKLPAQNAMNPSVVADSPPSTSKTPASSGPSSQHVPAVSSTSGSNTTDWLLIVAGVVAVLGVGFVLYRLLARSGK
jgi:hypothetical protein